MQPLAHIFNSMITSKGLETETEIETMKTPERSRTSRVSQSSLTNRNRFQKGWHFEKILGKILFLSVSVSKSYEVNDRVV